MTSANNNTAFAAANNDYDSSTNKIKKHVTAYVEYFPIHNYPQLLNAIVASTNDTGHINDMVHNKNKNKTKIDMGSPLPIWLQKLLPSNAKDRGDPHLWLGDGHTVGV